MSSGSAIPPPPSSAIPPPPGAVPAPPPPPPAGFIPPKRPAATADTSSESRRPTGPPKDSKPVFGSAAPGFAVRLDVKDRANFSMQLISARNRWRTQPVITPVSHAENVSSAEPAAMPEQINKFAAEKDKRTSVAGLRALINQNQKRKSALPSWVKQPAPIAEEEPQATQETLAVPEPKEQEKLSHVSSDESSESEADEPPPPPPPAVEVSAPPPPPEQQVKKPEEKQELKEETKERVADLPPPPAPPVSAAKDAKRGSVIRQVVKPRAQNIVSTNIQEFLESDQKDNPDKWIEITNIEGDTVYLNKRTGQTTFLKPTAGTTSHQSEHQGEMWFWVPDQKDAYVPAKLVNPDDFTRAGVSVLELESYPVRELLRVPIKEKSTLIPLEFSSLKNYVYDLLMLDEINQALILYNLKNRFQKNRIYTTLGKILISINPYQLVPLYTPSVIEEYKPHNRSRKTLPPHIYDIAADAQECLTKDRESQCIIITGESGSGKTEASKQCLQYLAEVGGTEEGSVEDMLIKSNPILESFGNAKTIRNDNSSRFGKWTEIYFNDADQIIGGKITNYLLEKSRVVMQDEGERNYHIFYQACRGFDKERRAELQLLKVDQYQMLTQSKCTKIPHVSDEARLKEVLEAFEALVPKELHDGVFKVISAVLRLGNLKVRQKEDESSEIINFDDLKVVANLIGASPDDLAKSLTTVVSGIGKAQIQKNLNKVKTQDAIRSMSKTVYGELFQFMVEIVNKSLIDHEKHDDLSDNRLIGILDIYGFEIFPQNSFEQLCINYANEKLQQHFVKYTFKMEQRLYKDEGLTDIQMVAFVDNAAVLELIEKVPDGILKMLDDEIKMPGSDDIRLVDKMNKQLGKKQAYKSDFKKPHCFIIEHYAGDVIYGIEGFVSKCKDEMSHNISNVLMTTDGSNPLLALLFPKPEGFNPLDPRTVPKKATLGQQFRTQLEQLMTTLESTRPHYVKCVKPNHFKKPGIFEADLVLKQLKYTAILESVEITQQGFPYKLKIDEFIRRFRVFNPKGAHEAEQATGDSRMVIKAIIDSLNYDSSRFVVGRSMVFYRMDEARLIDARYNLAVDRLITKVQKRWRGVLARYLYKELQRTEPLFKEALMIDTLEKYDETLAATSHLRFETQLHAKCKKGRFRIIEIISIRKELNTIIDMYPDFVFEKLEELIERADFVDWKDPLVEKAKGQLAKGQELRRVKGKLNEALNDPYCDEFDLRQNIALAKQIGLKEETLITQAEQLLKRIEMENAALLRLQEGVATGGPKHVKADHPKEVTYDKLGAAIREAKLITKPRRGDFLPMLKEAEILLSLRESVVDDDWERVAVLGVKLQELKHFADTKEVAIYKDELKLRAQIATVKKMMADAIETKNLNMILHCEEQAKTFEMEWDPEQLRQGMEMKERLQAIHALADVALEEKSIPAAAKAMQAAEDFEYQNEVITNVRVMLTELETLFADMSLALHLLDRPKLEKVQASIVQTGFKHELCEIVRYILAEVSEKDFCKLALNGAMILNDRQLIITRAIKLKSFELEYKPGRHSRIQQEDDFWEFENCPALKDRVKWAKGKWTLHRSDLQKSFTVFSPKGIHESLTELTDPKAHNKKAITLFASIRIYMGDKSDPYPLLGANQVIQTGIKTPELRDEIYCQIMKQLSKNPSKASVGRGWKLLAMCLSAFGPEKVENYLDFFIRNYSQGYKLQTLSLLYERLLFEPVSNLSARQIDGLLKHGVSLHNIEIDLDYCPRINVDQHPGMGNYQGPLAEKAQIKKEIEAMDSVFSV